MAKSSPPSSSTHRATAPSKSSARRTSTPPMPSTRAPGRSARISAAAASVRGTLRPIMQASAPSRTIARTCALQMLPAPPVQKTTLFSRLGLVRGGFRKGRGEVRKRPGRQTGDMSASESAMASRVW
jgi:hypothetical protein